jgi:cell division protein FtsB
VVRRSRTEQRSSVKTRPRGKRSAKRRLRAQRTTVLLRWCVLATAIFVAFLYYRPLSSYMETRATLNERQAEVRSLRAQRGRLQARLAESSTVEALTREARRMSLVRPGERLFVVKGIEEWKRAQARHKAGATIGGDG